MKRRNETDRHAVIIGGEIVRIHADFHAADNERNMLLKHGVDASVVEATKLPIHAVLSTLFAIR